LATAAVPIAATATPKSINRRYKDRRRGGFSVFSLNKQRFLLLSWPSC
jgi:hypothetical protein